MIVDNTTIAEMFDVLHDKIVLAGPTYNYIEFQDVDGNSLCEVPFADIVEDTSIPGEFYFEDAFGVRVIRGVVAVAETVSKFKIYDSLSSQIIEGTVTLTNGGGDITFNSLDWDVGQVVIISSLKIYFPTES